MYKNLEAEMTRYEITQKDIAKCINRTEGTTNLKMNGKAKFDVNELFMIRDFIQTKTDKYLSVDYLFKK